MVSYSLYHKVADAFIHAHYDKYFEGGGLDLSFDTSKTCIKLKEDDYLLLCSKVARLTRLYDSDYVKALYASLRNHYELDDVIVVEDGDFLNAISLRQHGDEWREYMLGKEDV
jgi:hypothetical protein